MKTRRLIPFLLWPILASPAPGTFVDPLDKIIKKSKLVDVSGQNEVVYNEKAKNGFIILYDGLKREISLCQQAVKSRGKLEVYDVRLPIITYSVLDTMVYLNPGCNDLKDYVGMAHNHPLGNCEFSDMDKRRFAKNQEAKIETIVCFASMEKDSVVVRTKIK